MTSNLIEQARIDAAREMYVQTKKVIDLSAKHHGPDPEVKKIAASALIKLLLELIEDDAEATSDVIGIFAYWAGGGDPTKEPGP